MFNFIKTHLPQTKKEWALYSKKVIPLVIGSIFFNLNGFVDNFMVSQIPGGVASLSFGNAWTAIYTAILLGVAFVGSIFVGQYYGARNYKPLREVISFRIWISLAVALFIAIIGWIIPHQMLAVFSQGNDQFPDQSALYFRLIIVSWILLAWSFNSGNLLRETGYARESFIASFIVLMTNVTFNSIFLYGLKMGVEGAAFASIISRIAANIINNYFLYRKDKKLIILPWQIFHVSKTVFKQFWMRAFSIVTSSLSIVLVVFRAPFWNASFPHVGDPFYYITGPDVLGLALAVTNIMTSGFATISGSINFFVGSHFGKNQAKQGIENAKKVIGFSTLVAVGLSVLTIIIIFLMIQSPYFAEGVVEKWTAHNANKLSAQDLLAGQLKVKTFYYQQLVYFIAVICCYGPVWMIYVATRRIIASGGNKVNLIAFTNLILGACQIAWLAILTIAILPHWKFLQGNLWFGGLMFYASDIVKMIIVVIMKQKLHWFGNLNEEYEMLKNK